MMDVAAHRQGLQGALNNVRHLMYLLLDHGEAGHTHRQPSTSQLLQWKATALWGLVVRSCSNSTLNPHILNRVLTGHPHTLNRAALLDNTRPPLSRLHNQCTRDKRRTRMPIQFTTPDCVKTPRPCRHHSTRRWGMGLPRSSHQCLRVVQFINTTNAIRQKARRRAVLPFLVTQVTQQNMCQRRLTTHHLLQARLFPHLPPCHLHRHIKQRNTHLFIILP